MVEKISQISNLQNELTRLGQMKNRTFEVRIGEQYLALFANGQLIRGDFKSITDVISYLTVQAARETK